MEKKAAKVCIYAKGSNILTAVFAVDDVLAHVQTHERTGRPITQGTTIVSRSTMYDPILIHAPKEMTLAAYEKYLSACGYIFIESLFECKGESVQHAFKMAKMYIKGIQVAR